MANGLHLDPRARADDPARDAERDDATHEVTDDLAYQRLAIVNVAYFGQPGAGSQWVLIDAGLHGTAALIRRAAGARFGEGTRPACIILSHGHFDHVGALKDLAEDWQVPIYAHTIEHPYLDGRDSYPPPDPSVGGGLMARLSPLYPRGPYDFRPWLRALPDDGSVPGMPGWVWVHTPGHAPGHVSLWRAADRSLIVGDAFVTTKQESVYHAITQEPELHGPPAYYTPDWIRARASVQKLAALEPEIVVTGHGRAMRGEAMRRALHTLADRFDELAVPKQGKYVPPKT
jgi:glyoxylase-like metal-dependent hydrolase (beta-lactamase superfamily II)